MNRISNKRLFFKRFVLFLWSLALSVAFSAALLWAGNNVGKYSDAANKLSFSYPAEWKEMTPAEARKVMGASTSKYLTVVIYDPNDWTQNVNVQVLPAAGQDLTEAGYKRFLEQMDRELLTGVPGARKVSASVGRLMDTPSLEYIFEQTRPDGVRLRQKQLRIGKVGREIVITFTSRADVYDKVDDNCFKIIISTLNVDGEHTTKREPEPEKIQETKDDIVSGLPFVIKDNDFCRVDSRIPDGNESHWSVIKSKEPYPWGDATFKYIEGTLLYKGTITDRAPGSTHTWMGKLAHHGYTFDSDKDDPLQFQVDKDRGYVYLKGRGTVTFPDGKIITLPLPSEEAKQAPLESKPSMASESAAQKTIRFTLVSDFDKKVPRANAAIFFAYYDPKKSEWQKSSQQTDSSARCSFLVPSGEQGESYTFLYATAQDEMDKAIKEVSDHKRSAWRIPPGEQQDLELLIDGRNQSNTEGSVQMWGIRR